MKQILFVDDKPAIGKVLSVYLGKENELVYFEDPVRAIEWLNEGNEPALIISDIRMPKMTGSEFLAYLKGNSLFKDIPVVMLSSEESTNRAHQPARSRSRGFHTETFQSYGAEGPYQEISLNDKINGYVILYLHR